MASINEDPTCNKWSTKFYNCGIIYKLSYCNSIRILRDVTFKIDFVPYQFPNYLNKQFITFVLESVCVNTAVVRGVTKQGTRGLQLPFHKLRRLILNSQNQYQSLHNYLV